MKLPIVFIIIYLYLHCSGCEDLWSPRPRPIIVYKERPQNRFDKIQKTKDETLNLDCFADYPVRWLTPDNSVCTSFVNNIKEYITNLRYIYRCIMVTVTLRKRNVWK